MEGWRTEPDDAGGTGDADGPESSKKRARACVDGDDATARPRKDSERSERCAEVGEANLVTLAGIPMLPEDSD